MKIIKKLMMITPLMLSLVTMVPISSCAKSTNLTKPTSISRLNEEDVKYPIDVTTIPKEDLSNPIVIQTEAQYVTKLNVTNKEELCGVQIGSKTKIQMGIYPEDAADKSLEFESTNPDVAVVEDGCVVAKSNGQTEIKVRANMSCPQHSISTFFYVNVYTEGCKVTFTNDGNGTVTKSYVNVQVGSTFNDIIDNYDISCIPNEGYKLDEWYDVNGNVASFSAPITSGTTIKATFKRISFEADNWENISNYAFFGLDKLKEIYQVDTFVGRTKNIYINGFMHEVKVIDEEHDTCTNSGKKAPLTFQLTTLLSGTDGKALETQWDTGNNYNYTQGYLKGNLTGNGGKQSWSTTAWDMLPSDLKKCIKPVNKTIWEWNSKREDGHFVEYSDYLFALTCTEYGQTNKEEEYHTEGTPYKYWVDHNYADARRFYDANFVNKSYWLASPCTIESSEFHIGPYGHYERVYDAWYMPDFSVISHKNVEQSCAVTFGFCI